MLQEILHFILFLVVWQPLKEQQLVIFVKNCTVLDEILPGKMAGFNTFTGAALHETHLG